jgi:hypothetical protein
MSRRLIGYAAAAVCLRLADEGARVALALLGLASPGGAALGAAYIAVLLVPHVLAAPALGLAVDRSDRPGRVVAAADAIFGIALLAAAASAARGDVIVTIALLFVGGCCGPAVTGALTSQLPGLVAADRLPRAFGLDALTYNVSGLAGPMVAASVAAIASPVVATATLGVVACGGAAGVALLPLRAARERARAGVLTGLRAVVRERPLAAVTATSSLAQIGAGALPVFVAVAATRAGTPAAAGEVFGVAAVAGTLGSLLWTWRPAAPARASAVVLGGLAASGLPLLVVAGRAGSVLALVVGFAVMGLATGPVTGALQTVRQRHAPPAVRSQVFSVAAGIKITCTAVGAALAGTVAGASGAVQFGLAGAVPVLAAIAGIAILARPRFHPRP